MRWFLVALVLASACSSDRDGDGFDKEFDCDDRDAEVHPEATEICDGIDNDCDGSFAARLACEQDPDCDADFALLPCNEDPFCDEPDAADARLWYADFDDDGFGDSGLPAKACEQPIGWVDNGDDCDDNTDTVTDECL